MKNSSHSKLTIDIFCYRIFYVTFNCVYNISGGCWGGLVSDATKLKAEKIRGMLFLNTWQFAVAVKKDTTPPTSIIIIHTSESRENEPVETKQFSDGESL